MWTIIKYNKQQLNSLKKDFSEKLDNKFKFYIPKLLIQKYKNNKLINKEISLLGNYLLCFHEDFKDPKTLQKLKFSRGLEYFLNGFKQSQNEINDFIHKCKNSENDKGFISHNFYKLNINSKYKFSTGPFADTIFKIINLQKDKIDILMGNIKTTIKKKRFLFNPV